MANYYCAKIDAAPILPLLALAASQPAFCLKMVAGNLMPGCYRAGKDASVLEQAECLDETN